jgi:hypothetical protein
MLAQKVLQFLEKINDGGLLIAKIIIDFTHLECRVLSKLPTR